MGNNFHFCTLALNQGSYLLDFKKSLVSHLSGNCCMSGFWKFEYWQQKFPSSSLIFWHGEHQQPGVQQEEIPDFFGQGVKEKNRCIFIQCCGFLYKQIWKIIVWSSHVSLFTHDHHTANIQGKTERLTSVTKQVALRKPKSHESYPQLSPYIGR